MVNMRVVVVLAGIAGCGLLGAAPAEESAAPGAQSRTVQLDQGEVGRWSGFAARTCGMYGKRWAAVDAVCYYPVDIGAKPGRHEILLEDQDGRSHTGWAEVSAVDWPEVEMELADDRFVTLSPEDAERAKRERTEVLALFKGEPGEPRFSLPLADPARDLPRNENDFGSRRTFNGKAKSQHTGRDYPVAEGRPVRAVADGTVLLAADHFLTGNSVYVDHGGGLVSMNFHLDSLAVKTGDEVERGQELGKVGATGRATGPHLHLGLRWMAQRVDPEPLLTSPLKLHEVGEAPRTEARKSEASAAEPVEGGPAAKVPDDSDEG
ncbi:MAG: M23 family metallopeptidase [Xanthomonadales bacterium]|nr:M23 family metallopeptidase [Xanthomonadales bacterium]